MRWLRDLAETKQALMVSITLTVIVIGFLMLIELLV